jgi:ferritin-like metal-binding protein YciE
LAAFIPAQLFWQSLSKTFFMERMDELRELLQHDVQLLLSAEEQLIAAMPAMIARATNPSVKQALEQHLEVTRTQRDRINEVRGMIGADKNSVNDHTGLMARLMGGGAKCKGMEGLIDEGQKLMGENLSDDVMDAAIIGAAQKIEHFEIASYGTARTFAQHLGLTQVAQLLQQTLDEEYQADDLLTQIAVSHVNVEAIH